VEAIVGGVVIDLWPEADASPVFSSTVVLTCTLISVSVFSGGDHNRGAQTAKHSTCSLTMMLLDHGSDGEPQVYAQLGQHHPRRITVSALRPALLFEHLAA
jgi:hypothetical protein